MKRNRFFAAIGLIMAVGFAACTNDELMDSNTLPEDKYPLEIASVTMEVNHSQQPWGADVPQTRVSESNDRNSSHWEWNGTEQIGVQIEGSQKSGIYKLTSAQKLEPVTPAYWENKQKHKICAWYPADGNVDLSKQTTDKGLAYALYAETADAVDYNTENITLQFAHKLAKVRVTLDGDQAGKVTSVQIKTKTSCTLGADGTLKAGSTEDFIPMVKATYNGKECWEANVVPNVAITQFQVNGKEGSLKNGGITPLAAKVNTITLTVGNKQIDLNNGSGDITVGEGNYIITGSTSNRKIIINGSPTVILDNITITHTGTVIDIQSGSPVFVLKRNNTVTVNTDRQTFIQFKGENSVLTIRGNGKLQFNDTASQSSEATLIGSPFNGQCGNIVIEDCTIEGGTSTAAAIGSSIRGTCGNITIRNATIKVTGSPAIGSSQTGYTNRSSRCGNILIENCNLTLGVKRGYGNPNVAIGAGTIDVDNASTSCGTITITHRNKTRSQILQTITGENLKIGKGVVTGNGSSNSCGQITITGSDGTKIYSGDTGVPNN